MLTRDQAEQLVAQTAGYPEHDEAAKAELRAAAARKCEREAEDFRAFAAVDQAAYAGRITAAVDRAVADLEAAHGEVTRAEDKAGEALRDERAAQDRPAENSGMRAPGAPPTALLGPPRYRVRVGPGFPAQSARPSRRRNPRQTSRPRSARPLRPPGRPAELSAG